MFVPRESDIRSLVLPEHRRIRFAAEKRT